MLSLAPCLIFPSDNVATIAVPDHAPEIICTDESIEPNGTTKENKPNWRSTASATAKLLLRGVRDSADAFGPLKSVAGGLCFILENYEVRLSSLIHYPRRLQVLQRTKANRQTIESLAPRIRALLESLCAPVSEGDTREKPRRNILER